MPKVDVLIAGGGAVGSATAYFLTGPVGFTGSVAVVEPDPAYHLAASTRSAAECAKCMSGHGVGAREAFRFKL